VPRRCERHAARQPAQWRVTARWPPAPAASPWPLAAGAPLAACRVPRRRLAAAALGWIALQAMPGCAGSPRRAEPWEARLRGTTIALFGEVHDNPEHHRLRAAVLRRALHAGWQPAVVMEQFDIDRQADIERSRDERPRDAAHLIARAGAGNWAWRDYAPLVQLALENDLPLLAGNLPRATAARLVRETPAAVFGAERCRELGLDTPIDAAWQAAQEREIDVGHCGRLPSAMWPGMARAQFARDAVMAERLRQHAARGAVLLAGNGHVRRDLGVPRWLHMLPPGQVLAVGWLESGGTLGASPFDAVVVTAPAARADPCASIRAPAASGAR
jgi:uncharacterized iron-regulated protein